MNLNDREQYEAWFRIDYGKEPVPRTSPTHDFCWAGYKAGQESMRQQLAVKQAEIDDLMLKYCRNKMTPQQFDNWAQAHGYNVELKP